MVGRLVDALPNWRFLDSIVAGCILAFATLLMFPVRVHLNVLNVSLLFLILVIAISLFSDRWTSIAAAFVAFLLFDVFFIPPYYTFTVAAADHVLVLFVFLGVAALTSQLVYRARSRTIEALRHGRRMELLFELSRALITKSTTETMLQTITERVVQVLGASACAILMPGDDDWLEVRAAIGPQSHADDRDHQGVARWVFEHQVVAGLGQQVGRMVPPERSRPSKRRVTPRPDAATIYVPITAADRRIGVLRVSAAGKPRRITADEQLLLQTFANQAALALERVRLAEEATQIEVLERSDALKSALLSAVSHDLRTPLASIKAAATSLLQEQIVWDPADERDLLTAIDEETDRLTRIVSNLLDLTRIEAGVLKPIKEWNDMADLIHDTVHRARLSVLNHPISVVTPEDLPEFLFDYVELAQVLTNLIENAAKYSPNGSGIEVSARADRSTVTVCVADRGPGIAPGDETRIFHKFYRGASQAHIAGVGVGLSICQGILHAHGGRIWVDPRDGGGAVFRFTLPIGETSMQADKERQPWAPTS